MRRLLAVGLAALGAACGGDGPTGPLPSAEGERLVIAPGALLFAAAGDEQQLRAYSVDEDGDSTEVAATFESSNGDVVSVTAAGLATGGSIVGSSQIIARSGDLVSAPLLALRATPAPGALLVADSQVVGAIEPADPNAAYGLGWRYRVRLRQVAPAAGQILLATGGAPVGGRVVSATPSGAETIVVLELIAIGEMFADLEVGEQLSLEHAKLDITPARGGFRTTRLRSGGIKAEAGGGMVRLTPSALSPTPGLRRIEQEFDLGPFSCKAEVPAPFAFPLSLDVFSFEVHPTLALDLIIQDATVSRMVVEGSIAPTITANPLVTAALEAKAECKVQLATLILPIGGPLSLIIGGQVPLGVGFEIAAKASFGQLGFDAFLNTSVDADFGIDCAGGCQVVADVEIGTPNGFFKPKLPSLSGDLRVELGAATFGWGELAIGNAFLEALRFKTVELKAGLEQKMELATREAQANDAAYASSFSLKPVIEAKAAANLDPIAQLLSINLATLAFTPELPVLAKSPRGTFTISPSTVTPGNDTQLGQAATFTVSLTDVMYLGLYAVEVVEIRWRKSNGTTVTLEPGRPGCTDLVAANGQMLFTCSTDFLQQHAGTHTFYAFVKAKIFGVSVPVSLEIGSATLTVGTGTSGAAQLGPVTGSLSALTQFQGQPLCSQNHSVSGTATSPSPAIQCISSGTVTDINGNPRTSSATGNTQWTFQSTPAGNGQPASFTGNIGTSASADQRTWGTAEGVLSLTFTVAGAPMRYELTGSLSASGPEVAGWDGYARVRLVGSGSDVFDLQAGRREAGGGVVVAGPASRQLDQSGVLQPGTYTFQLVNRVGDVFTAFHTEATSGAATNNPTLTLRPQ